MPVSLFSAFKSTYVAVAVGGGRRGGLRGGPGREVRGRDGRLYHTEEVPEVAKVELSEFYADFVFSD